MRPVLVNMGLVLQLAGILIAFPIGMGFIYDENQAIILRNNWMSYRY